MTEVAHPLPEFARGVALVAGGSGGIGAAIALDLAAHGANVVVTYRSKQAEAERVAGEVRAKGRDAEIAKVDLTDAAAVKALVDHVAARSELHSIVYAAGPAIELGFVNQVTSEAWASTFRADVDGCFNFLSACLPHLRRQRSGNIVAVVTCAVDRPPPRDILSAAPKAAIQALVRGIAREEGRSGIRANCVGPGWIDAGLGREMIESAANTDYVDRFLAQIPLRRTGSAAEVAHAVTFLLSRRAAYVTGATIPVAGGLQL